MDLRKYEGFCEIFCEGLCVQLAMKLFCLETLMVYGMTPWGLTKSVLIFQVSCVLGYIPWDLNKVCISCNCPVFTLHCKIVGD